MASQEFKTHRVTELPSPLEAYAVYFVAPAAGNPDYVEIYVTSLPASGPAKKHNLHGCGRIVESLISF